MAPFAAAPVHAQKQPQTQPQTQLQTQTLNTCSWDRPGANPFTGDVVAAVDRYTDIPVAIRNTLKSRIAKRNYDEVAAIGRDSITGKHRYSADIRDMHFGAGQVCRSVTRSGWPAAAKERGLVYCEQGHCIIVPTVCRNVSRITRLQASAASAGGASPFADAGAADPAAGPATATARSAAPDNELLFEAPSAGQSAIAGEALPAMVDWQEHTVLLAQPSVLGQAPLAATESTLPAALATPVTAQSFEAASNPATSGPTTDFWTGTGGQPGVAGPWQPAVSGSGPVVAVGTLGTGGTVVDFTPPPAVPESSSALMALVGLVGLALVRRQRLRR